MMQHDENLRVRLARDERDLLAAQRLRYRVFVNELKGDGPGIDHAARTESDAFDSAAEHLLLVDRRREAEGRADHVVGAYRLIRDVRRPGRFYSEAEFDLSPLKASGRPLLELGRSCIDAAYRNGLGLWMLWNALAGYVARHRIEILFGVASFHGSDPAPFLGPLAYLHHHHLAPEGLRPRAIGAGAITIGSGPGAGTDTGTHTGSDTGTDTGGLPGRRGEAMQRMPGLIKAYLRIGGGIGQGACIDRAFNTIDVCMVLDTARISPARRARFTAAALQT